MSFSLCFISAAHFRSIDHDKDIDQDYVYDDDYYYDYNNYEDDRGRTDYKASYDDDVDDDYYYYGYDDAIEPEEDEIDENVPAPTRTPVADEVKTISKCT